MYSKSSYSVSLKSIFGPGHQIRRSSQYSSSLRLSKYKVQQNPASKSFRRPTGHRAIVVLRLLSQSQRRRVARDATEAFHLALPSFLSTSQHEFLQLESISGLRALSAPASRSTFTTTGCPYWAAMWSGVRPRVPGAPCHRHGVLALDSFNDVQHSPHLKDILLHKHA